MFQTLNIVDFDQECTHRLVTLKKLGRELNKTLSFPDYMIAATALAINAILVTNDQAFHHFMPPLVLEDWLKK